MVPFGLENGSSEREAQFKTLTFQGGTKKTCLRGMGDYFVPTCWNAAYLKQNFCVKVKRPSKSVILL